MVMIMQRSVFLVLAREKKTQRGEKDARPANKQHHCEENLWSFITRLQQQQLNHVKANKLHRFFSSASLSPPIHILPAPLVIFFSPICVTPNTLPHPCFASPLTDCLICSLMLSGMQQPFCGSLLWCWTCISLPDRRRKQGQNRKWRKKWVSFMPNRREGDRWESGGRGGEKSQKTCHSEVFTKRKERQPVEEYSYTTTAGSPIFYNFHCTKTQYLTAADRFRSRRQCRGAHSTFPVHMTCMCTSMH